MAAIVSPMSFRVNVKHFSGGSRLGLGDLFTTRDSKFIGNEFLQLHPAYLRTPYNLCQLLREAPLEQTVNTRLVFVPT
jgi:hypothetical protein